MHKCVSAEYTLYWVCPISDKFHFKQFCLKVCLLSRYMYVFILLKFVISLLVYSCQNLQSLKKM